MDPESGYRYYSEAQTATAAVIAILRSVDMPLAEIRELLRDPDSERGREALDRHLARLQAARTMLDALRELMKEGVAMVSAGISTEMVEVEVGWVRVHRESGQHVVLLRERDGDRGLTIWVGMAEANAIAVRLHGLAAARPMTHDLLATAFERSGAEVERVALTRQEGAVYYATIVARCQGRLEEIDARPYDAIALALRAGAPILVARSVMDRIGVPRSEATEAPAPPVVVAMTVDAETGRPLGLVHLPRLPAAGDHVDVPTPVAREVASVEAADGERLPRLLVRRPT